MKQQRKPPGWFYLAIAAGMLMAAIVLPWLIGLHVLAEGATER